MSTESPGLAPPHPDLAAETPSPAIPQTIFQPGQVLDNTYRIERLIGEGGMGLVYEATHARLAGRYAIKVVQRGLSDNPEALARFDREARITSWLQHPNIVHVIDFNRLPDGTEYLVMEYLNGESLAERLRRVGAFPLEAVGNIVDQIAAAVGTAHAHRIVHRDLKPDNIFLLPVEGSSNELVKVLDFGISKVHDTTQAFRSPQSGLMGTPQYMAPEQCRGQGAAPNGASDQFALAVITFEMITGRGPFISPGDSVGTVLSRVLYEDTPPMGIDPIIERVVRRGLAKAPQDRYPSVIAFAQALRGAIAAHVGHGPPHPALARRHEPTVELLDMRLRRRWPWAIGATVIGMAAAVIIGNIDLGRRAAPDVPLGVIAKVPAPPTPRAAATASVTPGRPTASVAVERAVSVGRPVERPVERAAAPPSTVATQAKPAPARLAANSAYHRPRPIAPARRVPGSFAPGRPAPAFVAPGRAPARSTVPSRDVTDDEVLPLSFDSPP